jgi:uncharacterized metal-binding protein
MSVDCAACVRYACRKGRVDAAPETCPMHGDFPPFDTLYGDKRARSMAYHAARVEAEGYCRWTRVREVVEVCSRMGYERIGIARCPDMGGEAKRLASSLAARGLDAVLADEADDCDPTAQAAQFRARGTDLNVIAGMCVGHDALFMRHSAAPVTALIVRDIRLRHNPAAALYLRTGYFKSSLYGKPTHQRVSFRGWDDALLDRLAREVRDAGAARDVPPCRLEEVMDFARRAGVRHLGVVFCSGFREEARQLKAVLGTNGFQVSSVCCKTGAVPKERLGITDAEKVHPGQPEMMCNPLAQAELLEREEVELVLLMGQCVGHDSATMAQLTTPAVCFVAKDRVLGHNTVAALHELREA